MNPNLTSLYHRMPPTAQNLAASLHGWRLRRERYGPETDGLVEAALERETWAASRWRYWEEERLAFILRRAATRVPYYREMWSHRRRLGDQRPWDRLENWPVLEKDEVRQYGSSFIADDQAKACLGMERTSGTSGTPLTLWRSRGTTRARYALYEARRLRWYGADRHDRWAILGGQLVTSYSRRRPPFWVWNAPMRQLYLSSYHLAPEYVPAYLDALERYRVKHVIGYPSSLYSIAKVVGAGGAAHLGLKAVVTNAEPLYAHQRESIEAAFGCCVRETYGMVELVAGAGECEHGQSHLWPEIGVCEVRHADGSLTRDGSGELVATSLLDADMPLIRYRVGDTVALGGRGDYCRCGRTLPLLRAVDGRSDDLLYTLEGRPVGRLDPVFKVGPWIAEAQIIQESLDLIRVRVVPDRGFGESDDKTIKRALRGRLGDVCVAIELVPAIPRTSNGKFRAVVSRIDPQELTANPTPSSIAVGQAAR